MPFPHRVGCFRIRHILYRSSQNSVLDTPLDPFATRCLSTRQVKLVGVSKGGCDDRFLFCRTCKASSVVSARFAPGGCADRFSSASLVSGVSKPRFTRKQPDVVASGCFSTRCLVVVVPTKIKTIFTLTDEILMLYSCTRLQHTCAISNIIPQIN